MDSQIDKRQIIILKYLIALAIKTGTRPEATTISMVSRANKMNIKENSNQLAY